LSPKTIYGLKSAIEVFVHRSKITLISAINIDSVREFFYEGIEVSHWSYWTIVNYHKYLKKFFVWCIDNGYMTENPVQYIKKPKKPQSLPRRLSYEEGQKVLSHVSHCDWRYEFEHSRNHAIIATFLYSGLRAKELLNLKMMDVDLRENTLFVREGKGNKDRIVPIHTKLGYILKYYLRERKRLDKKSEYLFTGVRSDLPLSYKNVGFMCKRISKVSGVKFTPHCLRHTFGSVAIEQGMGIVQLKEILGHSNIASTMIYLKMSPKGLQESLEKLELF